MQQNIYQIILLICMGCLSPVSSKNGFDVATYTSLDSMKCLWEDYKRFVIVRGYVHYGALDKNAWGNLKNAKEGGFPPQVISIYMSPCVAKCEKGAAYQVYEMLTGLAGCDYGRIWLDIHNHNWYEDKSLNIQWAEEAINTMLEEGKEVGIYSSYDDWDQLMGLDYVGLKHHPLWYIYIYIYIIRVVDHDNKSNFYYFKSFGGWEVPDIKQYSGTTFACGASYDENWN